MPPPPCYDFPRALRYLAGGVVLVLLLASCGTTKYLAADESFLSANAIVLADGAEVERWNVMRGELQALVQQQRNTAFFGINRRYFAYRYQRDSTRFNAFLRKTFGEAPALYSPAAQLETVQNMENYLYNRGYFRARVEVTETTKKRKTAVTYYIQPNRRYLIDSVRYVSRDTAVQRILRDIRADSHLQPGEPVDSRLYDAEVKRVVDYLRDRGYADLYTNAVAPLEADSSNYRAVLDFEVLPPAQDSSYRQFRIGRVEVYTNYIPIRGLVSPFDTTIQGVEFHYDTADVNVRFRTLLNNIQLRPGELFNQRRYDQTNLSLGGLGTYRFVSLRQNPRTDGSDVIDISILLTPNSKWEFGMDVDVSFNNTNGRTILGARNLLGLNFSPSLRSRNFFGGAEALTTSFNFGLEFNPSPDNNREVINTLNARLQSQLDVPRFTDYLRLWRAGTRIGLVPESLYEQFRLRGRSRLSGAVGYTSLLNFYNYSNAEVAYGFNFTLPGRKRLSIDHLGIDYLLPTTQPAFDVILANNPFLANSFDTQLFTGFVFRNFLYSFPLPARVPGVSSSGSAYFELSGHEIFLVNKLTNALRGTNREFRLFEDGVAFSRYAKLDLQLRNLRPITSASQLAFRFNVGAAVPYGCLEGCDQSRVSEVPYVKQFTAGGPMSMRGWRVRELGPGGFFDPESVGSSAFLLFQTGDLKLETNLEYRFFVAKIIAFDFNGALFADVGNVWTLREDPSRPGSQFRFTDAGGAEDPARAFYHQLAINTGIGTRLDFSYFLLRVDIGFKLRNPYPGPDTFTKPGRYWLSYPTTPVDPDQPGGPRESRLREKWNWNLMLGLPF